MNTKVIKNPLKRFLPITTAALLTAIMSSSALALPSDASGNLDVTAGGLPRLSPDTCFAANSVNAMGSSNFPVRFRLFRDGSIVSKDGDTAFFKADNGTFQFLPGTYKLEAINTNPTRPARIIMSLVCS